MACNPFESFGADSPAGCELEHFRFTSWHQDTMEGGFFLRKNPLVYMVSVKSRIENAVSDSRLDYALSSSIDST
jgi:hypothetical protein